MSDDDLGFDLDDIAAGAAAELEQSAEWEQVIIPTSDFRAKAARARRTGRSTMTRAVKAERFAEIIGDTPLEPGDSLHILSRGLFDSVTIPLWFADTYGDVERFSCSTLTVSRNSLAGLQERIDQGTIKRVEIIMQEIGLSKSARREEVDYIWQFIRRNDQLLRIAETHAKVQLIERANGDTIVVESSANLTSNDSRLEQYSIFNYPDLHRFHREWFDEILSYGEERLPRNAFPGDPRLTGDA